MPSYSSYVRQMSVLDNDDDITWITVKGNHIPIKKGQSKGQALREFFESKKSGGKKTTTKSTSKNLKRSWKSEGSGKAKYGVGQKVSVGGKEYEVSSVKPANLSKEPYYKLSNGEWRHENEITEIKGANVDPDDLSREMLEENDFENVGKMIVELYNDGQKTDERFVNNWLDEGEIWGEVDRKSVHESVKKYMEEKYPSKEQKRQKVMENLKKGAGDLQFWLKVAFRNGSFRDFRLGGFSGTFGSLEEEGDTIRFSVRDLGDWDVSDYDRYDPDYADEDFSDWDWKEPTEETRKKIATAIESMKNSYKDIDVEVEYGEKNYAYFTLSKKGKKK